MVHKFLLKKMIKNNKARFDYLILETFTAGVVLHGRSVKEVRAGKVNLNDTYAHITSANEVLTNITCGGSSETKLLLTKREIRKIKEEVKKPGLTLVPLDLHFEHGLVKCTLGLCKGKKEYDKRQTIKKRDLDRELRSI